MIVPEGARNIEFVGHTDQGGRGDGVQVMVARGHAYVGTRVAAASWSPTCATRATRSR